MSGAPTKSPVQQIRTAFAIAREVRTFLDRVKAVLAGDAPEPAARDWESRRPVD